MKGYAVYKDHGQLDGGWEFQQVFIVKSLAEEAVAAGLGTDVEEIEIFEVPIQFKIRHTVHGTWRRSRGENGIPLSGEVYWDTRWDEFVYWETYSGYDKIPDVKVTKTGIAGVTVTGLDKEAISAAYSEQVARWKHNRAGLVDLSTQGRT